MIDAPLEMYRHTVGIIGYRNHSKKLINIFEKNSKIKKIIVFCYKEELVLNLKNKNKNKKIFYTKELSDLKSFCNLIIISSPSDTHFYYLKYFIKYKKYIFCEKPGFINKKQIRFMENLPNQIKSKIYFNYNLLHSNFYQFIKKNKNLDKEILHMSYHSSTGIAFLKKFRNNWRFTSKDIMQRITGNWGVHSTNLALNIFGKLKDYLISEKSVSSKKKIDTCSISLNFENNKTVNIFLSYAAPMNDTMTLFFTNKILKYEDCKVFEFSPRNHFDKKGLFKKPPKKNLSNLNGDMSNNSLENSVKYFIDLAINNKSFPKNLFNNAIETVKVFLKFDYKKN